MATKAEIRMQVVQVLDRWHVPPHLYSIRDVRGRLDVHLLPSGGSEAIVQHISTGIGPESIKAGLAALDAKIRRGMGRGQSDLEDFTA